MGHVEYHFESYWGPIENICLNLCRCHILGRLVSWNWMDRGKRPVCNPETLAETPIKHIVSFITIINPRRWISFRPFYFCVVLSCVYYCIRRIWERGQMMCLIDRVECSYNDLSIVILTQYRKIWCSLSLSLSPSLSLCDLFSGNFQSLCVSLSIEFCYWNCCLWW